MTNDEQDDKRRLAETAGISDLILRSDAEIFGALDKSDEEWAAHDLKIRNRQREELAKERQKALQARGATLCELDAPERIVCLIVDGEIDRDSQVMKDIDTWRGGKKRIAVLSGPVGVGKTVAAVRWLANFGGSRPCFVRAGDFEARGRYGAAWRDRWQAATGLILDDLGSEYQDTKGNLTADLDTLIDRYANGRGRLIITTNITWEQCQARYGERIASRIVESASWFNIQGADLRRIS